jgi:hypothetical protein
MGKEKRKKKDTNQETNVSFRSEGGYIEHGRKQISETVFV